METVETGWRIELARTLWYNTYRARVSDAAGDYLATLRIIPAMPIDRDELPADAPAVEPYLLVLVEDAACPEDELAAFEARLADELLAAMAQHGFAPAFCQFAYPSPPGAAETAAPLSPSLEDRLKSKEVIQKTDRLGSAMAPRRSLRHFEQSEAVPQRA